MFQNMAIKNIIVKFVGVDSQTATKIEFDLVNSNSINSKILLTIIIFDRIMVIAIDLVFFIFTTP